MKKHRRIFDKIALILVKTAMPRNQLTLLAAVLGLASALSAAEPFVGAWKLNPAKSMGSTPKDETILIQRRGAMLTVRISIVTPDNRSLSIGFSTPRAGGIARVEEGPYNGVSVKRDRADTMDITYLTDGKAVRSTRAVIAKSGRTLTSTGKAIGSNEDEGWVMVFDKQSRGNQ
jgi:hypothetical protein